MIADQKETNTERDYVSTAVLMDNSELEKETQVPWLIPSKREKMAALVAQILARMKEPSPFS